MFENNFAELSVAFLRVPEFVLVIPVVQYKIFSSMMLFSHKLITTLFISSFFLLIIFSNFDSFNGSFIFQLIGLF